MSNTPNVLSQKAVLASLNISRWAARAMDHKATQEVHRAHGTSSEAGRYWKRLIDKSAMSKVVSIATAARNFHYQRTQPWLDGKSGGQRLLPSAFYPDYRKFMVEKRGEYAAAADEFAVGFVEMKRTARVALNGLYNERDYPRDREIRDLFSFDFTIIGVSPIDTDFRIAVGNEFVEDIRRDLEKKMGGVLDESRRDCAERIVEAVGHMAERLRAYKPPQDDGEKTEGAFRDSLVENVRELATLLPAFNYDGNKKMTDLIARIDSDLCAVDASDLRNDELARRRVAKAAEDIVKHASAFI
jgi:hypothetical protein